MIVLGAESNISIQRYDGKKLQANPEKFKAIML